MKVTDRLKEFDETDLNMTINALKSVRSAWLRDPAVVAVDVGYRLEHGQPIKEPCHLYIDETEGHKKRLCAEEIAEAFDISPLEARAAIKKKLDGEPVQIEGEARKVVKHETFDKPWIRVHVDRRMTPDQVRTLGRSSYHQGLEFGGEWYPVAVIDALYKPMAKASVKGGAKPPDFVTRAELERKLRAITKKWNDLQSDWKNREEYLKGDITGETRNRRKADAKDRTAAHEELENHERALKDRIQKVEEILSERYALSYLDSPTAERRGRAEPLTGGVSVGASTFSCGTLSTIVWDKTDCRPCLLSTWHVLASGGNNQGAPVTQPAHTDGGLRPRDTVARLKRWQLSSNVDAALAELNGSRGYAGGSILEGPQQKGALTIQGAFEQEDHVLLGLPVWKFGRTSGLNRGLVDGVAMSLCMEYGDGTVQIFHDQLHVLPHPAGTPGGQEVSQAGDSGAIWMSYDNRAVGLQFAGDMTNSPIGDFSVANRMTRVAEELKFSLTPIFVHPREMLERQKEAELRAEIAEVKPPEVAHETARELVDVMAEIFDRVIERFDETDVTRAMGQIRQVLGPINTPQGKPGSG